MWVRFTKRARELFDYAQDEAATRGQREVDTEHLLLAITRNENFVAYQVLSKAGFSLEALRIRMEQRIAGGMPVDKAEQHLTPAAHRVTDLAYEEVRATNGKYIGTEHLLLGLIAEEGGIAAQALQEAGVDPEQLRVIVKQMHQGL